MKEKYKRVLMSALFTIGGAVTGLAYYYTVGCAGGTCALAASPTRSVIYMAVIGWLLSQMFVKQPERVKQHKGEMQ